MIRVVAYGMRPTIPKEILEQTHWLSHAVEMFDQLVKAMPAGQNSWDIILNDWSKIKNRVQSVDILLQKNHNTGPIPDWAKTQLQPPQIGNQIDEHA